MSALGELSLGHMETLDCFGDLHLVMRVDFSDPHLGQGRQVRQRLGRTDPYQGRAGATGTCVTERAHECFKAPGTLGACLGTEDVDPGKIPRSAQFCRDDSAFARASPSDPRCR